MKWMIILLQQYERNFVLTTIFLLILLNSGSLYFIIDLMNYDEMVGYLADGSLKVCSTRHLVFVMLGIVLANILFVFASFCAWYTKR